MSALKRLSFFKWTRNLVLAMLAGVLFLTNSAFVDSQGQTTDPYARQVPADGVQSKVPEALAPALPVNAANIIQDPSFEASYGTFLYWDQFSLNFGTPFCIVADCSNGAGTAGPRSGSVWAWFGGTSAPLEQSGLAQTVSIPSCGAKLNFYLWIGRAASGSNTNDYLKVSLNGNGQLFRTDATKRSSYTSYKLVTVNIAPGTFTPGANDLVFTSETSNQIVTFNVDDVALIPNCVTISGNAGVAGATLQYTGGSTTSDGAGNYSFNRPAGWSGTVTPSKANYVFSPVNRSYSNVTVSQPGQNFTATILYTISGNTGAGGVTLTIFDGTTRTITSQSNGNYSFTNPSGWTGTVTPSHPCFNFTPANRNYNNVTSNLTGENYTPALIGGSGCADVDILIGGVNRGSFGVPSPGSTRASFTGVDAGPVQIQSTNAVSLIGAERLIYKVNNVNTSFSEMMGLPNSELDNVYWLPWYNNVNLDTQLRFANATANPATVTITIGGVAQTPINLAAGESTRISYAGIDAGPVKIESTQNIVASERIIYKVNNVNTSFSEMMALPEKQLDTTYWLPWYNNVNLDSQLRFANVTANPATVTITIGGVAQAPINLAAGESTRISYAGIDAGPIKIESTQPIVASERVIYKINNIFTSFSEMMALPNNKLTTTYHLPWYNNLTLDTQLRIANVSANPATITVTIGGIAQNPINLAAGESTRISYVGIDNGPVKIVSTQNIVAAERVIYKVNNINTSFSEMMALPDSLLSTLYWFPWYNNIGLDTQLRFGAP